VIDLPAWYLCGLGAFLPCGGTFADSSFQFRSSVFPLEVASASVSSPRVSDGVSFAARVGVLSCCWGSCHSAWCLIGLLSCSWGVLVFVAAVSGFCRLGPDLLCGGCRRLVYRLLSSCSLSGQARLVSQCSRVTLLHCGSRGPCVCPLVVCRSLEFFSLCGSLSFLLGVCPSWSRRVLRVDACGPRSVSVCIFPYVSRRSSPVCPICLWCT